MKNLDSHHWFRRTGAMILFMSTLLTGELAGTASLFAAPVQIAQNSAQPATPQSEGRRSIRQAVRRDLAEFLNIRRRDVQIVSIDRQTWSDGCLGLAQPGQVCTQALVEGWRITARANNQTWNYRTDATGATVRREGNLPPTPSDNQLPQAVRDRVFQALSEQFNASGALIVASAERRTWNGCLGIAEPDVMCTMIAIPGWRVTIVDANTLPEDRVWVYHTNQDGTQVRFNPAESSLGGTIAPIQILPENLPQSLERGAVFRSIANGGMLPRQTVTTLYEDGRVVVQQTDAGGNSERSYRVSQQQVEQFRQVLQPFDRYNRLDFSAPYGAADYITVMLVAPNGVTQYADLLESRLPPQLQQVIEAWSRNIVQAGQTAGN